jgi:hypothetical protein
MKMPKVRAADDVSAFNCLRFGHNPIDARNRNTLKNLFTVRAIIWELNVDSLRDIPTEDNHLLCRNIIHLNH